MDASVQPVTASNAPLGGMPPPQDPYAAYIASLKTKAPPTPPTPADDPYATYIASLKTKAPPAPVPAPTPTAGPQAVATPSAPTAPPAPLAGALPGAASSLGQLYGVEATDRARPPMVRQGLQLMPAPAPVAKPLSAAETEFNKAIGPQNEFVNPRKPVPQSAAEELQQAEQAPGKPQLVPSAPVRLADTSVPKFNIKPLPTGIIASLGSLAGAEPKEGTELGNVARRAYMAPESWEQLEAKAAENKAERTEELEKKWDQVMPRLIPTSEQTRQTSTLTPVERAQYEQDIADVAAGKKAHPGKTPNPQGLPRVGEILWNRGQAEDAHKNAPVASRMQDAVQDFASGLSRADQAVMIAALGGNNVISKMATVYFAYQAGKGTVQGARAAAADIEAGNKPQAAYDATTAVLNGLLAGTMVKHGAHEAADTIRTGVPDLRHAAEGAHQALLHAGEEQNASPYTIVGHDAETGLPIMRRRTGPEPTPLLSEAGVPRETVEQPSAVSGQPEAERPVVQGSAEPAEIRASATEQEPKLQGMAEQAVAGVPGAQVEGSRVKDAESQANKAARGKPSETNIDHLGARVSAETPEALAAVRQNVEQQLPVESRDKITSNGLQADQYGVRTGAPGEANQVSELQVVPKGQADAMKETDPLYEKQKEALARGDQAEADRLGKQIEEIHKKAQPSAVSGQQPENQGRAVLQDSAEQTMLGNPRPPAQPSANLTPDVQPVREPEKLPVRPAVGGHDGRPTEVLTPTRKLPGIYRLVEASDLAPSHHAQSFEPNPEYPAGVQERDYKRSKEAQNRVIDQAQNYDPAYTVNTNPDAVNGPPVITPDGTVLGGNSRAMSTQRVYAEGRGETYRDALRRDATAYGLTPEQVVGMKQPVLVRQIDRPASLDEAQRIGSELNKNMTGALGVSERAVSAGKKLKPETLQTVSAMQNEDDSSLREVLGRKGPEILQMMVQDGALTERERPQYLESDGKSLSEEGKTFIERAMMGSVFNDSRLLDAAPKSIKDKIEKSLGSISAIGSRPDEWNLIYAVRPALLRAVAEHTTIARNGSTVELTVNQRSIFGPGRNPVVDALVKVLDEKPNAVRTRFQNFATDAKQNLPGATRMFGGGEAFDAFNHAFGSTLTDEEFHHGIADLNQSDTLAAAGQPQQAAGAGRGAVGAGASRGNAGEVRASAGPVQPARAPRPTAPTPAGSGSAPAAEVEWRPPHGQTNKIALPVEVRNKVDGSWVSGTARHYSRPTNGIPGLVRVDLADGSTLRDIPAKYVRRPEKQAAAEPLTSVRIASREIKPMSGTADEAAVIERTKANAEKLTQEYLDKYSSGGIPYLATDAAKELFPEFQKDPVNNDRHVAAGAKAIRNWALDTALARPVDPALPEALITTASPGSGKTSTLAFSVQDRVGMKIEQISDAGAAFNQLIQKVIDSGRRPTVEWIYVNSPAETVRRALRRAVGHDGKPGIGRTVQLDYMAEAYYNLPRVLEKTMEKFGDQANYRVVDNSGPKGTATVSGDLTPYIAKVKEMSYDQIKGEMYGTLEQLKAEGLFEGARGQDILRAAETTASKGIVGAAAAADRGRGPEGAGAGGQSLQGKPEPASAVLEAGNREQEAGNRVPSPRSAGESEVLRIARFTKAKDAAKGRGLHENAVAARPEAVDAAGRRAVALDADSAVLWHRAFAKMTDSAGRNPLGAGQDWLGVTLPEHVSRTGAAIMREAAAAARKDGRNTAADGYDRMAKALTAAKGEDGLTTVLRGDYRDDTAREEAWHGWAIRHELMNSDAMREIATRPEVAEMAARLRKLGYGAGDPAAAQWEMAHELLAKPLAGDPALDATEAERVDVAHAFLTAAVDEFGPEILDDMPPVERSMQRIIDELKGADYGREYDQRIPGGAEPEARERVRPDSGKAFAGDAAAETGRVSREPGAGTRPTAKGDERGAARAGAKEGELKSSRPPSAVSDQQVPAARSGFFQRMRARRAGFVPLKGEAQALPGFEEAVRERERVRGEDQRRLLTEEMRRPGGNIDRAAGEMERNSPLFFGKGEQPSLFQKQLSAISEQWGEEKKAPTWFLKSARVLGEKMKGPMAGGDLLRMLENNGVKPDEIKWSGLEDLRGKARVTPDEVREHLAANAIAIKEVQKGKPVKEPLREIRPEELTIKAGDHDYSTIDPLTGREHRVGKGVVGSEREARDYLTNYLNGKRSSDFWERNKTGETKFGTYTLPGGENYREMLLTLPAGGPKFDPSKVEIKRHRYSQTQGSTDIFYNGKILMNYGDDPQLQPGGSYEQKPDSYWMDHAEKLVKRGDIRNGLHPPSGTFTASHWDESNVLGHVRFNDRTGPNGEKLLHVEELQSDWHQKGRTQGYTEPEKPEITAERTALKQELAQLTAERQSFFGNRQPGDRTPLTQQEEATAKRLNDRSSEIGKRLWEIEPSAKNTVPDAPFKKTWPELLLKRMVRYAAENGYDGISWTPGEQQAERYDLSKKIGRIVYEDDFTNAAGRIVGPKGHIQAFDLDGHAVMSQGVSDPAKELPEIIGKEATQKLLDAPKIAAKQGGVGISRRELSGLDLKVGGEGMKGFYDQIVPEAANKLGKAFGAKVGEIQLGKQGILSVEQVGNGYEVQDSNGSPVKFFSSNSAFRMDQAKKAAEEYKTHLAGPDMTVPYLPVTDAMRQSAMQQGFPMFQRAGEAGATEPEREQLPIEAYEKDAELAKARDMRRDARDRDRLAEQQKTLPFGGPTTWQRALGAFRQWRDQTDTPATELKGHIREQLGEFHRNVLQLQDNLRTARAAFVGVSEAKAADIIDNVEHGRYAAIDAEHRPIMIGLHNMLEEDRLDLQKLDPEKLKDFYENYFPHIWDQSGKVARQIQNQSKSVFGPGSFLQHRTLYPPTFKEGIAIGLRPKTWNPVDMALIKHAEIRKYIFGLKTTEWMDQTGMVKTFTSAKDAPVGWSELNEPYGRVMSRNDAGEMVERGRRFAPADAANVFNNFVSKGIRGKYAALDAAFGLNNGMNRVQLGLSAFHGVASTLHTAVNDIGMGLMEATQLRPEAAKTLARAAVPGASMTRAELVGTEMMKEYLNPGSAAKYAAEASWLARAGGMPGQGLNLEPNSMRKVADAFAMRDPGRAAKSAVPAAMEGASSWLLGPKGAIVRLKMGMFQLEASNILKEAETRGWAGNDVRGRMQKAWDSIDNRYGQMVYENLFAKRWALDVAQLGVRSVGWNLGSFREYFGGASDTARAAARVMARKRPEFTSRMAFTLATPIYFGLATAAMDYLINGKGPDTEKYGLKAYFYPEMPDGSLMSWPGYMKDWFSVGMHPVQTALNKTSPLVNLVAEQWENKDYYGNQIRNEDDPLVKQLWTTAESAAKEAVPFTFRSMIEQRRRAGEGEFAEIGGKRSGGMGALSYAGFQPAPKQIQNSAAMNQATHYLKEKALGSRTEEQAAKSRMMSNLVEALREGRLDESKLDEVSPEQYRKALREANETPLETAVRRLDIDQALQVWKKASPSEREQLRDVMAKMAGKAVSKEAVEMGDEAAKGLMARLDKAGIEY